MNSSIIIAMSVCIIFTVSGCSKNEQKQVSKIDMTRPTSNEEEATINPTEKMFKDTIDNYLKALPKEQSLVNTPIEEQNKLVENMRDLFNKKASSNEVFNLYINGIPKLLPDKADKFTAYAVSALRRNSFEDYKEIEKYASNPEFIQKFFQEAERENFNYLKLNANIQNIKDPSVREVIQKEKAKGYYIASAEGMLYPLVDFSQIARFRGYNHPAMASLIETFAIDDLEHMTADAGFIVKENVLAARTYGIEQMIKDYRGTRFERYLVLRFKDHMNMIFFGVNNSPAFNYETNLINKEFDALYKNIITIEGSFMAQLVKEYNALLVANGGKLTDATRQEAIEILKKIDTKYGLTQQDEEDFTAWISGKAVVF